MVDKFWVFCVIIIVSLFIFEFWPKYSSQTWWCSDVTSIYTRIRHVLTLGTWLPPLYQVSALVKQLNTPEETICKKRIHDSQINIHGTMFGLSKAVPTRRDATRRAEMKSWNRKDYLQRTNLNALVLNSRQYQLLLHLSRTKWVETKLFSKIEF